MLGDTSTIQNEPHSRYICLLYDLVISRSTKEVVIGGKSMYTYFLALNKGGALQMFLSWLCVYCPSDDAINVSECLVTESSLL